MGPFLVTAAAGRVGAVVELLRQCGLPVRALVHREDERADSLRSTGAEVVVADLAVVTDVTRAMEGCRRIYFGMSVSRRRTKSLGCVDRFSLDIDCVSVVNF